MKLERQRLLLIMTLVILGVVALSLFFWPEWTEWKVRLGVLALAISMSLMYRERPLRRPRPARIKPNDPLEVERQRLKNWANNWR